MMKRTEPEGKKDGREGEKLVPVSLKQKEVLNFDTFTIKLIGTFLTSTFRTYKMSSKEKCYQ